ncbi:MAG: hypothetical protein ISR65_18635 [Bacteriovoracaceae bacterium]|nr:hypothetical protein [Bacteriovoracaceae bacterium]
MQKLFLLFLAFIHLYLAGCGQKPSPAPLHPEVNEAFLGRGVDPFETKDKKYRSDCFASTQVKRDPVSNIKINYHMVNSTKQILKTLKIGLKAKIGILGPMSLSIENNLELESKFTSSKKIVMGYGVATEGTETIIGGQFYPEMKA